MTSPHITRQLQLSRISELHKQAAADRLANEVAHGDRVGVPTFLVRWLRVRRRRARGGQPQAASDRS
jgi:hypothetical protein